MKIAIWWNIPCKSVVPVARELANIDNHEVIFISQSSLSESRKKLGWELPEFGNAKYIELPKVEWKRDVEKLVLDNFDLHIFNGVYQFKKIRYALDFSIKKKMPFGVISEAYHNPYSGYKRTLKSLFTRVVTPLRVIPRSRNAKFILSASGSNIQPFLKLGWREDQFYPFGYFPENIGLELKERTTNSLPQLLCTGYITKNKGQHILLQALSRIKKAGIGFNCIFTGFGPEEENVKKLSCDLHLNDCVNFAGVVKDSELNTIKNSTDLFVAPGLEEPWGIRINEAILAYIPVITSDKIGASELILSSKAGRVFVSGNVDSLFDVLKDQLVHTELEISKQKAKSYALSITPHAAAQYLSEVIAYSLYESGEKPHPNWLLDK